MRYLAVLPALCVAAALGGCNPEESSAPIRPVRAMVVHPKQLHDGRLAVGEVKPRYESELSFRVAGKMLNRYVEVGGLVKQGDTLAKLDTQDYQNRLRSAEADVMSAEAAFFEAQGAEGRQAQLLSKGFTTRANYDTALRNLRAAEAKLRAASANLDLARDQLDYTELKAEFDGVITAIGAEAGQNVVAGQMVMRLARPEDKDAVFSIAEGALAEYQNQHPEMHVWPLSNSETIIEGVVREISPVADPITRTYAVKATLKNPPSQIRFGMSVSGSWKGESASAFALPLSALFEKKGAPAVWVFEPRSNSVLLKPVSIARYEADSVIVASGLTAGEVVVTAGINTLRENQKVRLTGPLARGSDAQ